MLAAWYEKPGPAAAVLQVGEMAAPEPGPGEVRVRVAMSGINPGDTKKRGDWLGFGLPFPRIVPHSDGSGVIDAVWACLGIPGITAHRTVFGDGPVAGTTVLVHGVLGAVGSLAAQLARWGGATVIGTVRRGGELGEVDAAVTHAVALDAAPAEAIRALAPDGVQRIVDVALPTTRTSTPPSRAPHGVIAAYASRGDRPGIPFWPMLFANLTLRLLGSDAGPRERVLLTIPS